MTQIPFYTVDAFASHAFKGNPAAVCIFKHPDHISDVIKQRLASEFNLSESAFPSPLNGHNGSNGSFQEASEFSLQWFTPKVEVPLCGHATLAAAHVIFNELGNQNNEIHFETKSGRLSVQKAHDGRLQLNFPQYEVVLLESLFDTHLKYKTLGHGVDKEIVEQLANALVSGVTPIKSLAYSPKSLKLIVVLDRNTSSDQLLKIQANDAQLLKLHPDGEFVKGIILTLAPVNPTEQGFDDHYDYVLRYFAPWSGISEDPATGSAQCVLAPFWSQQLNKTQFKVLQCYPGRGADFDVELDDSNDRVKIYGRALTIFSGQFSSNILEQ